MRRSKVRPAGALGALALSLLLGSVAAAADRAISGESDDAVEAEAEEIELEDVFGFTEGAQTGEAGEREISTTIVVGSGRRGEVEEDEEGGEDGEGEEPGGEVELLLEPAEEASIPIDYLAVEGETEFEFSATDRFKISAGFTTVYFDTDYPGEFDNEGLEFGGLSIGAKYGLLQASDAVPFNLALGAEAEWQRFSEESGDQLTSYELAVTAFADTVLVPEVLFAAGNLTFSTETGESDEAEGEWEKESGIEASLAVSYLLADGVFVGAETRLANAFEGGFLEEHIGHALYAGPTAFAALSDSAYVKAAWAIQVAGEADADPGADLNLIDFNRHEVLLGVGFSF